MDTYDKIFGFSFFVLMIYWVLIFLFPEITSPFSIAFDAFLNFSVVVGYPGSFIISFLGNATILFPFPYVGVPFILGGLTSPDNAGYIFDPWLVGLLAGIGATLGEITGYIVGYLGGRFIEDDKKSRFREFVNSYPRVTPLIVWFLAITPIPDDVVIVPLGAARYSWWQVLLPMLIGKTMFLIGIAWAGRFGLVWIAAIFGARPTDFFSKSIEVASIVMICLALFLLVKIDWSKIGTKRV